MGFADMDFRVVPNAGRMRRGGPPCMVLIGDPTGSVKLMLNQALRTAVGIEREYELLLNGRAIAVRAAPPKAMHRRVVSASGQSTVTALGREVFRMQPGERFELPATIDDGHAWAYLPDTLVRRMKGGAG